MHLYSRHSGVHYICFHLTGTVQLPMESARLHYPQHLATIKNVGKINKPTYR